MRRRHALRPLRTDALGIMCDKCRCESRQGLIDFQTTEAFGRPQHAAAVQRSAMQRPSLTLRQTWSAVCAGERSSELERQAEAVDCRHVVSPSRMLAATPGAVCSS
jgi:hypothetical protein